MMDPEPGRAADHEAEPSPERAVDVPLIRVAAAVIRREGAVLLGLRPAHKRHGSRWEFPGGKVLDGESLEDALARELEEELGVRVIGTAPGAEAGGAAGEAPAPLFVARDPGSPFEIHFVPVRIEGTPRAVEHEELRWVPVDELGALPLAPADARFARERLGG